MHGDNGGQRHVETTEAHDSGVDGGELHEVRDPKSSGVIPRSSACRYDTESDEAADSASGEATERTARPSSRSTVDSAANPSQPGAVDSTHGPELGVPLEGLIARTTTIGFAVLAPDHRVEWANPAFRAFTQCLDDEPLWDALSAMIAGDALASLRQANGKEALKLSEVAWRSGERLRYFDIEIRQLVEPGERGRCLVTLTDATESARERRRFEAASVELARSEQRHRALVLSSSQIVWTTDAQGRVTEDSTSFRAYTGQSWEAFRGIGWIGAIYEPDRDRVLRVMDEARFTGRAYEVECRLVSRRGEPGAFLLRGVAIRDAEGRTLEWVGACTDVTEQRRLHEQLMIADRLVSVGTMAAGVAHEINNPLAYVLGNVELVASAFRELRGYFERFTDLVTHEIGAVRAEALLEQSSVRAAARELAELAEALDDARLGAERVRDIIRDLKTFSGANEEGTRLVDLRTVLDGAAQIAGNEIRHRARLVKTYAEIPRVVANESQLGQVFLNLLLNAAQAIPEDDGREHQIELSTLVDGHGDVVVEVRDTGVGISGENLSRVFDPFFTTKPVGSGTGLGLSIGLHIVRRYGGTIAAHSEVGRGTTMRVVLPALPQVPKVDSAHRASTSPTVERGKRRVLVIDDEPQVLNLVARALEREHDVTTLQDGRDAVERLRGGERYDVILCDVMMPEASGMWVYEEIRRISQDQSHRIVFLTGGAFTPAARSFVEGVPNPRVGKPFELAALRRTVESVTKRRGSIVPGPI